jgi:ferric-dicitrate binding protein FerR (iron transport regulator)
MELLVKPLAMKRILLVLAPVALFAAQARYARLGEFQGNVEVQLTAADLWISAQRNLPLPESASLRTGPASRLEIELDEGSAIRLGPNSECTLADYTRLSTGQRITLLWIERGQAWFTGQPEGRDSMILAAPGAQITPLRGARVRFEAEPNWTQIAILEGVVRFASAAAEIELREGHTTRVEPSNPARFFLNREIAPLDLDRWSEDRDKVLEASPSAAHVVQRYGLQDLDSAGEWIQTDDLGTVW